MLVAVAVALVLAAWARPATASTVSVSRDSSGVATYERCHQHVNFVFVPLENAERAVPEPFEPIKTADRLADLQVKALACEQVSVDGRELVGPVRMGWVGVDVDCRRCEGDANFYLLSAVTDSEPLARWLVRGTDLAVEHVPAENLVLTYAPLAAPLSGAPYFFGAPSFEIDGTATEQDAHGVELGVTWWQNTRRGTVRLAHPPHVNFVSTGTGEVSARDGAMEEILGARKRPSALALSERIESFDEVKTILKGEM